MNLPPTAAAAPVGDPTIDPSTIGAPQAQQVADQDMTIIQVPHEALAMLASVLPGFTQLVVAAAQKSASDIAQQKGQMSQGAPGTMAPEDQNSPESLAAEIGKMRR